MPLETIPFEVRDVVEGTVELLSVQAHQKDLELACWIEQGVVTRVRETAHVLDLEVRFPRDLHEEVDGQGGPHPG